MGTRGCESLRLGMPSFASEDANSSAGGLKGEISPGGPGRQQQCLRSVRRGRSRPAAPFSRAAEAAARFRRGLGQLGLGPAGKRSSATARGVSPACPSRHAISSRMSRTIRCSRMSWACSRAMRSWRRASSRSPCPAAICPSRWPSAWLERSPISHATRTARLAVALREQGRPAAGLARPGQTALHDAIPVAQFLVRGQAAPYAGPPRARTPQLAVTEAQPGQQCLFQAVAVAVACSQPLPSQRCCAVS